MMGRIEQLTLLERISRLSSELERLKRDVSYGVGGGGGCEWIEQRKCDGSPMVLDGEGEPELLVGDGMVASRTSSMVLGMFDDKGSLKCAVGVGKDGALVFRVVDQLRERDVLWLHPSEGVGIMEPETLQDKASILGVDMDGRIGVVASSKKFKKDIKPLEGALEMVKRVRPIRFKWVRSGADDIGFLNEELEDELGLGVHELIALVAILWQALRELSEEVASLKAGGQE